MTSDPEVTAQPTDRRQRILQVASELFATRGYDGTSMRDVSEACAISKSLLYHHFANKEDLYRNIVLSSAGNLYDYVRDRVPTEGSAADKIRAFMLVTAEFFDKHRWAWIAATTAFWSAGESELRQTRLVKRDSFEQHLRSLLQEGIDNGEFGPMDVAMTGRLILSSLNWMYKWYNPEKSKTPQDIAGIYFDTLLNGLAVRPA
ncbi:MAG: TetR/AcrR family transcriptional regulator [Rhodobacter sp.]|nr:TetR family transcriptional regulator [Paracoccaceae bacterium]MCC0076581.1 TetR/AcrR family transcriptional regulator [Rhodobacter sp.]